MPAWRVASIARVRPSPSIAFVVCALPPLDPAVKTTASAFPLFPSAAKLCRYLRAAGSP